MDLIIGTAGWTLPASEAPSFPPQGSALQRYAAIFSGVEINSSFHRSHRLSTWQRWAASVPEGFAFSAKLPKTITHASRLVDCSGLLRAAIAEQQALGDRLSVHLVQLPPSLAFDPSVADRFFGQLREISLLDTVCEPRHPSWFEPEADRCLRRWRVARVAADPARVEAASVPGDWGELDYYRLHGSPFTYRSSYDEERLDAYAARLRAAAGAGRRVWCVFDNTASSAATGNALRLMEKLGLR